MPCGSGTAAANAASLLALRGQVLVPINLDRGGRRYLNTGPWS